MRLEEGFRGDAQAASCPQEVGEKASPLTAKKGGESTSKISPALVKQAADSAVRALAQASSFGWEYGAAAMRRMSHFVAAGDAERVLASSLEYRD